MMYLKTTLLLALVATLWSLSDAQSCSTTGCPTGWRPKDGKCYKWFGKKMSYKDAQQLCESNGATLPMPKTAKLNDAIYSMVPGSSKPDYWIGLDDQANEGKFTFIDGTPLCYFNKWARGRYSEPNDHGGRQDCAAIWYASSNGNQWFDKNCNDDWHGVLCEQPAGITYLIFAPQCFFCPSGWTMKGVLCYKFVNAFKDAKFAKKECEKEGGILALPKSAAELANVLAVRKEAGYDWKAFWLGLDDKVTEGVFVDNDGCTPHYTNWQKGEPDNSGNQDCTVIYGRDEQWDDLDCRLAKSYMCQKDAIPKP